MEIMPKDPVMKMSFINMKMRDEFHALNDLCATYGLNEASLIAEMKANGFDWMPEIKQFR